MRYSLGQERRVVGVAVVMASLALSACGGGGGGGGGGDVIARPGGPTPPATQGLTTDNFLEVAAVAFGFTGLLIASVEETFDSFGAGTGTGPISATSPALCDSGSGTITINFGDGVTLMAGDTVLQTFNNCVRSFADGSRSRVSGEALFEVLSVSGVRAPGNAFEITTRSSATNLVSEELAGPEQGDVNISDGDQTTATSNDGVRETTVITTENGLSLTTLAETIRLVYQLVESRQTQDSGNNTIAFSSDHNFQLTTARTNGSFATDTTQTFVTLSGPELTEEDGVPILRPTTGAQVTTDGRGASVSLTALPDGGQAEIVLDLNGDTIPEASQIVSFQQLEAIIDAL